MSFILDLEPKLVWKHFDAIRQIPRCSKHEEKIRKYIVEFAESHKLEHQVDEAGNVVIRKPGTKGMEIGRDEQKMGQRSSGTVAIHFDDCVVPDSQLIGDPENGYRMALGSLTRGRIGIAALSIGLAEAALAEGLAYAQEREAFGKRIVEFQNTQFVLAESRTELDAAWLLVLRAACLFDRGQRARQEASMAKYWATEATGRVIDRMLQLHGGYGYSEEYAIERIYRDHRVTRIYEGTNEIQRLVIAREMLR